MQLMVSRTSLNAPDDDEDEDQDETNESSYSELDERIASKSLELSMRSEPDEL